jgi:alpha-beta hydrolase superfamily lysophospholipase
MSQRAETIPVAAPPDPGGDAVVEPLRHAPDPTWIAAQAGYRIPVRRYGAGGPLRPVVMLHGLQSHSGWFVQSARRLAEIGMPVHAFDRHGSGVSPDGPEGGSRLEELLAEIDAVADAALAGGRHDAVYLIGHCFGAILALLYAALHRPERVAGLVLATPALYTITDLRPRDKMRVLWSVLRRRAERVPVPLAPEEFSELAPFVRFVREDPLSLRTVPARLMYEVARARRRLPSAARALRAPIFVAYAESDVICDNSRNRRVLARVASPAETHTYSGARHILEFSARREAFLDDLAGWIARSEQERG